MRIGHGFDAHRFAQERPLILGGVRVQHVAGLAAHSDGDVLIHALCDALLGAVALGDIGRHFPNTDSAYTNIDSRHLLRRVMKLLHQHNFELVNVDLTLIAQVPHLAPYLDEMVIKLSEDLGIQGEQINIKATTTERMGYIGREEGIACHAVVLLNESL